MLPNGNTYERAFENYLAENRVSFVPVNQQHRAVFRRDRVKSFDFLLYRNRAVPVIAELKGRLYKGKSLTKLTGLQCWVNIEDVRGLLNWQTAYDRQSRDGHLTGEGWFIFAYRLENIDVETDGREIYHHGDDRYMFYAIKADDYRQFMKTRSPKWKTVTLSADDFRKLAVPVRDMLF